MIRLLFWLLLALGGWWMFRTGGRSSKPGGGPPPVRRRPADVLAAPMRQCAYCGVHFPESDGETARDGRPYCTPAHLQAALHADTE